MDMITTPVSRLLLKLAPPVMLALLIQSVYNIADSLFIAHFSQEGLTALSIVYPMQLFLTAVATGTGAGVNLLIARMDGEGKTERQSEVVTDGYVLAVFHFLIFAFGGYFLSARYFQISSANRLVCTLGTGYMKLVFCGSFGVFLEGISTKILQARGNMVLPMIAQIAGACVNILLDPILIFGFLGSPQFGMKGAAMATLIGQWTVMAITFFPVFRQNRFRFRWNSKMCFQIYQNGIGSIAMQSLYTLYIVGLNLILKLFTEDAVTVLGIYYKIQTFFFIPLLGLQQVLLPVISNNDGAGKKQRIHQIVRLSLLLSTVLMLLAALIFFLFPQRLILLFSSKEEVLTIGVYAFRVIALSFLPAGFTIVFISYLQGIAKMRESVFLIVLRQVILLVPVAWILHYMGLKAVWWTFPVTEFCVALAGLGMEKYHKVKDFFSKGFNDII